MLLAATTLTAIVLAQEGATAALPPDPVPPAMLEKVFEGPTTHLEIEVLRWQEEEFKPAGKPYRAPDGKMKIPVVHTEEILIVEPLKLQQQLLHQLSAVQGQVLTPAPQGSQLVAVVERASGLFQAVDSASWSLPTRDQSLVWYADIQPPLPEGLVPRGGQTSPAERRFWVARHDPGKPPSAAVQDPTPAGPGCLQIYPDGRGVFSPTGGLAPPDDTESWLVVGRDGEGNLYLWFTEDPR